MVCLCAAPLAAPILKWLVEKIIPKYGRYFGGSNEFEYIFFAIGLAVFLVSSYYFKKLCDKPYFRLWYYMNLVGLFALCFSSVLPEMKRINYYFAAPHFLLLPLLPDAEENPKRRLILKWGIILFFAAETIVAVGLLNKNGILPYTPFWKENYDSISSLVSGLVSDSDALLSGSDILLSGSDMLQTVAH